jgi:membrane fusion protein (multidrug efflux system)
LTLQFSKTTQSLALDSPRIVLVSLALAGLSLLAWLLWFGFGNVTVYEVSRQARLEVGSAPREISSLLAGRLTRSHIVIGQKVRAGDVLVELDSERQQLRLAEAEARLPLYPAKIASLRREIAYLGRVLAEDQGSSRAAVRAAQARLQGAHAAPASPTMRGSYQERCGKRRIGDCRRRPRRRRRPQGRFRARHLGGRAGQARNRFASPADETRVQMEKLSRDLLATQAEAGSTRELIAQLRLEVANHQIRAPVSGVVGETRALSAGAYVAPARSSRRSSLRATC